MSHLQTGFSSKVSEEIGEAVFSEEQFVEYASLSPPSGPWEDGQCKTEEMSSSSLISKDHEHEDEDDNENIYLLSSKTIDNFEKASYQEATKTLRKVFELDWQSILHLEHYAEASVPVLNNVKIKAISCRSGFLFNEGFVLISPKASNPAFVLLHQLAIIAFALRDRVIAKEIFDHLEESIEVKHHQWKNELVAVKCNLGCFFATCGQYDRALRYFDKAEEIAKKQMFYLGGILNNVGQTYQIIGKYGKAERLFKDSLNILQHGGSSTNEITLLTTKHNLARLYKQQRRPFYAIRELREALNLCTEDDTVPTNFQGVLASELLCLLPSRGESEESARLEKYCVNIFSNIMNEDDGSYVDEAAVAFQETYADFSLLRGETIAAKTTLQNFCQLFQNLHGQDHPYLISLLFKLGCVYCTENNYKACADLIEKAENIATETYGASNPILLPIYSKLAELQFFYFKNEDLAKHDFEKIMKVLSCVRDNGGNLLENHLEYLKNTGILGSCDSLTVNDDCIAITLNRKTLFKETRPHLTKTKSNALSAEKNGFCHESEQQLPIELFFRFDDNRALEKNFNALVNGLVKIEKSDTAVAALKSRLQQLQKPLSGNTLENKEVLHNCRMISMLLKKRQSEHTDDCYYFDSFGKMIYSSSADISARNCTVSCDVLVMELDTRSVAQDLSQVARQNISVLVVEEDCFKPKFNVIASSAKPVDIDDLRILKNKSFDCIKQTLEVVESAQQVSFVIAINPKVESECIQTLCGELDFLPLLVHELIESDASLSGAKRVQTFPCRNVAQIPGKFPGVFLHKLLLTCFKEEELLGELCDFTENENSVSLLSIKPRKTHVRVLYKQGYVEIVINSLCSRASDTFVCDCALNLRCFTTILEKCAHSYGIQLEQGYSETSCGQAGERCKPMRRALHHGAVSQGKVGVIGDGQQQPDSPESAGVDFPSLPVNAHQSSMSREQPETIVDGNVLCKAHDTLERRKHGATIYSCIPRDQKKMDRQSRMEVSTQTELLEVPPSLEKKPLHRFSRREHCWFDNTEGDKKANSENEFEQGIPKVYQQADGAIGRVSDGHIIQLQNTTNGTPLSPDQHLLLTDKSAHGEKNNNRITRENEKQISLINDESEYPVTGVTSWSKAGGLGSSSVISFFEKEAASIAGQKNKDDSFDSRSSDASDTLCHVNMLDMFHTIPSGIRGILQRAVQETCVETQREVRQCKEEKANVERLLGETLFERDQAVRHIRKQQQFEQIRRRHATAAETDVTVNSASERQISEDPRLSDADRQGVGRNLSTEEAARKLEKRLTVDYGMEAQVKEQNEETKPRKRSSNSESSGDSSHTFGEDEPFPKTRYTLRQVTDRSSLINKSFKTSSDCNKDDAAINAKQSSDPMRHSTPDMDHQENQECDNSEAEAYRNRLSLIEDETEEQTDSGLEALLEMSDDCNRRKPDQTLQATPGEDGACFIVDKNIGLPLTSADTEKQTMETKVEVHDTGSKSESRGRVEESNVLSQSHRLESSDIPETNTSLNTDDSSENGATGIVSVANAMQMTQNGTSSLGRTTLTDTKNTETAFEDFEDNQGIGEDQNRETNDKKEQYHTVKADSTATFSTTTANVPLRTWNRVESSIQRPGEVVTDSLRSRSVYLEQGARPKQIPTRTVSNQRSREIEKAFVSDSPRNDGLDVGFLARHTRDASIHEYASHLNRDAVRLTLPHEQGPVNTADVDSDLNVDLEDSFVLAAYSKNQPMSVPNSGTVSISDYPSQLMGQPAGYSPFAGCNVGSSYFNVVPPPSFIGALPNIQTSPILIPTSSVVSSSNVDRNFGISGSFDGVLTIAANQTNHVEEAPEKESEIGGKTKESVSCEETANDMEEVSNADEIEIAELANLSISSTESFRSEEERVNTLEARVAEACAMVEQVFRERRAREQEIQEREQRRREERERALIERERSQREERERIARDQEERDSSFEEQGGRQKNSENGPEGATAETTGEVPSVDDEKYPVQESPQWLCEHYQRRCNLRFPCCNVYYPCHRCHNSSDRCTNESAKAHEASHLQCIVCRAEQPVTESYDTQTCQSCGTKLSEYFCPKCKHFTGVEKKPYHCDKCGICRIHKDRSFHCEVCNVCLDKRLEGKHKCRPDSGHDECCICLEDAFSGCQILPCSHKVHRDCAIAMVRNGIRTCPVCRHPLYDE